MQAYMFALLCLVESEHPNVGFARYMRVVEPPVVRRETVVLHGATGLRLEHLKARFVIIDCLICIILACI
jgi:hypothetical protein